jgi:hypothetical protein
MNRLLIDKDYLRAIQQVHLDEIILNRGMEVAHQCEQTAQLEMASYLRERYYEDQIFTNTGTFSITNTYYGTNLIQYTEPLFDISLTYSVDSRVSWDDGNIYINIATSSYIDPTDNQYWQYLVPNETLFYANTPYPIWNVFKSYKLGDNIWYYDDDNEVGNTYQAIQQNRGRLPLQTQTFDQQRTINNNFITGYSDLGINDGMWFGLSTENADWKLTGTYSFSGVYPIGGASSSIYWTQGDNRDPQIVQYLLDITLYHLYTAVLPRNIPQIRAIRYDGEGNAQAMSAIKWLKMVAEGRVSANLPQIIPMQGSSIMGHSPTIRRNNTY